MINLEDSKKYIHKLIKRAMIPIEERDDYYQDFCVFYYNSTVKYDDKYTIGAWLRLRFRNFLSQKAVERRVLKRQNEGVVSLEWVEVEELEESQGVCHKANPMEQIDMARLYTRLPPLFKILFEGRSTPQALAESEGISRQAFLIRLQKQMKPVIRKYTEGYV